jgi:hypothetical protein
MYRKTMAGIIMAVKAASKSLQLHPLLANYEPPKPEVKKDLAQLAKEVQATMKSTSEVPSTETKSRTGFKLKRERNTQRSLHDFFPATSVSEAVEDVEDVEESSGINGTSVLEQLPDHAAQNEDVGLEVVPSLDGDDSSREATTITGNGIRPQDQEEDSITPPASLSFGSQQGSPASATDQPEVSRLQEKIEQLSQAMREGMDQIAFIQKERQERRQKTTARPSGVVPERQPDRSPKPSHGHCPEADRKKKRKQKMADDFIKLLWPYMKQEKIGSKSAFKILARELTHKALDREARKGLEVRAQEVVAKFFAAHKRVQSDEEARSKLKVFRL